MFPKEHGAWNALIISLAAGWFTLGGFNQAALTASLIWVCGFILRAPLSTARQYRNVDRDKSRKALGFSLVLAAVLLGSAWVFWNTAADKAYHLVFFAVLPAGAILFILTYFNRSLRFLFAELVGFLVVCLAAPVIYLCHPSADIEKAVLLFFLFGGYFLSAIFYIRIRFSWLEGFRKREKRGLPRRLLDLGAVFILGGAWVTGVFFYPDTNPWQALGPLYALARMGAGALWGQAGLPMMRLGFREMIHSLLFTGLVLAAWK